MTKEIIVFVAGLIACFIAAKILNWFLPLS